MSPGPLRRITAVVGLLALAPIAAMLLTSALTPQQAAARAVMVVVVVLLVGNLVRIVITSLLHRVERDIPDGDVPAAGPAGVGRAGERAAAASGGVGTVEDGAPHRRAEDRADVGGR